jgi:hypothetical protein
MALSQPPTSSQAQNQTQTQSLSQTAPQTPTNKAARARAQEFAAAAARAVETLKAQESMPRYDMMSISTLRMLGVNFGLKATSKKMLSEQLTAIWERVHEGIPKADQQESEGVETESSNNGESSSRGVHFQQNDRRESDRDEPTARSSPFLDQDKKTLSPPSPGYVDDTAPGYMSPILSDNDHTYDHIFDNDNHYDTNYDMDYDNNYHNFDNDLQLGNHSRGYEYGLDNDASSDRGETFVNTKRGNRGGSTAKSGGNSQHKESSYNDGDNVDGGADGDYGSDGSDEDNFSQLSQDEDSHDGDDDMEEASDQEGLGITPPTLERQLFDFLSKASHLRKQYLTYKVRFRLKIKEGVFYCAMFVTPQSTNRHQFDFDIYFFSR